MRHLYQLYLITTVIFSVIFLKNHNISAQVSKDYLYHEVINNENVNQNAVSSANTFTDTRDNHVYKYISVGEQVWMAENLAYLPEVAGPATNSLTSPYYYVYGYNGTDVATAKATNNFITYGVIYNWPAAMAGSASSNANPSGVQGVCPAGWHLPSDAEWEELKTWLTNNGHSGTEGTALKTTTGWDSDGNGTDSYGFSGLPGGFRNYTGQFLSIGLYGCFWSATEYINQYEPDIVWYWPLRYNATSFNRDYYGKDYAFSVRCVKDDNPVSTSIQVSSTTLTTGETDCFNATQTITVAGDGTQVIVESGASANFIAGQNIRFLPGFDAQAGSYAHGYITTTDDYCVEAPPALVAAEPEIKEGAIVNTGFTKLAQTELVVYPNPNSGEFTVELRNFKGESRIILFNAVGQIVHDELTSDTELQMKVSNPKSGMYFIKVVNNNKQFSRKIVVR